MIFLAAPRLIVKTPFAQVLYTSPANFAIVIPGRIEDASLRCAIARRGISRFRVRWFYLRPGMTWEIRGGDEFVRVCASCSWCARRRLRDRPGRLRDRADGAGDLALRVAAFDRG